MLALRYNDVILFTISLLTNVFELVTLDRVEELNREIGLPCRPVNFRALYEFVDLHQDGDPYGNGPCSRIFYSRNRDHYPDRRFQATRDIFLYGRGGAKNIR